MQWQPSLSDEATDLIERQWKTTESSCDFLGFLLVGRRLGVNPDKVK